MRDVHDCASFVRLAGGTGFEPATSQVISLGALPLSYLPPIFRILQDKPQGEDPRPSRIEDSLSNFLPQPLRSEEHTSELQSLMRISYAVFCLKKKNKITKLQYNHNNIQQHTNKTKNKTT